MVTARFYLLLSLAATTSSKYTVNGCEESDQLVFHNGDSRELEGTPCGRVAHLNKAAEEN